MSTANEQTKKKRHRAKGTGSLFRPRESKYWWIAYVSNGKRHYESTKTEIKTKAQEILSNRLGDISKGIHVTPQTGKITIGDALRAVVDNQRLNGKQSADQTEQRITDHLLAYFRAEDRMAAITTGDLEAYQTHRVVEQKAERATVNRELAIVRRAFRLAMRGGKLASMPFVPMLTEDNTRQGFFERTEFDAILKHLPHYLHAPLEFMYVTGWRKSEVLTLTVAQVDLDAGTVRLEPGTTKSGEGRVFVLTEALQTLLTKQLASIEALKKQDKITPWVFHLNDGSQITNPRKAWETAREAAGYPDKLLHDFRRTAVRNFGRAGVARSTAMQMSGHKTESVFRRYAIQDEATLREGSAKIDAWTEAQQAAAAAKIKGQVRRFRAPRGVSRRVLKNG